MKVAARMIVVVVLTAALPSLSRLTHVVHTDERSRQRSVSALAIFHLASLPSVSRYATRAIVDLLFRGYFTTQQPTMLRRLTN
jgi:peptidoglycan biosynthesis protein MviN/MurJ (putative lipid II flippase)